MKLRGKVAIITGSGRGLGRASAVAMAGEGASVVIMSRTASELRDAARAIGKNVVRIKADVSRPADIVRVVDRALSAFGRIDILMNNAAVLGPVRPLHEVRRKEWQEAIAINLHGVFLFSRAVIPTMASLGGGKIINVTSGLGEMVMPPLGVYSVAKGGVIHMTRIMAEELKPHNIQVNGLDPGVMDTAMQEEIRALGPGVLGPEVHERFLGMKRDGRLASPEKAARLALFLASAESDMVTGANGTESTYRGLGFEAGAI
jgi:NAD(P)-dependent dehydrogenase (short-subunit alcohol dehydrogenase family)